MTVQGFSGNGSGEPAGIQLACPDVGERELQLLSDVLRSRYLSRGAMVRRFEQAMADFVGTRYAVAVSSGSAALHLLLRALGAAEGDEVITTSFSFVASTHAIVQERAVPVFADIEPLALTIDPARLEERITPRTRAILPVDVFGHPARLAEIREIAQRHGLAVVEDACEALGSSYRGSMAGSGRFCDGAAFGFYPNKQITTGEGGVVVTDREDVFNSCRSMRNQGRVEEDVWLPYVRLGYNYRLDEMSAAVGVAQMERIQELLARRAAVAELYDRALGGVEGVGLPYVSPDVRMSWFVYVIRLGEGIDRDAVAASLRRDGIPCRPYFPPIHLQPFYRERFGFQEGMLPITERAARCTLALPFHNFLTEEDVNRVAEGVRKAVEGAADR